MNARIAITRSVRVPGATALAIIVTALFLPTGTLFAQPVVSGCGTIQGGVVWNPGTTYVLDRCAAVIPAGSSLTIAAGAVVKLAGSHDKIVVDGSLTIAGTSAARVVVTSLRDDSVGGDTNGDGTATTPAPGDWGWIVFNPGSHGAFRHADLAFGGVGYHGYTEWAMVKVYGPADVSIDQSTLRESWNEGLFARNAAVDVTRSRISGHGAIGLDYEGPSSVEALTIRDNVFTTVAAGAAAVRIGFGTAPPLVRIAGNTAAGSGWNGVRIEGRIETDLDLEGDPDLPFLLPTSLSVAPTAALRVAPGTVFKASGCGAKLVVEGAVTVAGEEAAPVIFTSIHDDAFGGGTNGNATRL